jgi:hypothetical protein
MFASKTLIEHVLRGAVGIGALYYAEIPPLSFQASELPWQPCPKKSGRGRRRGIGVARQEIWRRFGLWQAEKPTPPDAGTLSPPAAGYIV